MRGNLSIHIIVLSFNQLETWQRYQSKWKEQYQIDPEKGHHTPELYTIWAEKPFFVEKERCVVLLDAVKVSEQCPTQCPQRARCVLLLDAITNDIGSMLQKNFKFLRSLYRKNGNEVYWSYFPKPFLDDSAHFMSSPVPNQYAPGLVSVN
jgi:hypothetical protein